VLEPRNEEEHKANALGCVRATMSSWLGDQMAFAISRGRMARHCAYTNICRLTMSFNSRQFAACIVHSRRTDLYLVFSYLDSRSNDVDARTVCLILISCMQSDGIQPYATQTTTLHAVESKDVLPLYKILFHQLAFICLTNPGILEQPSAHDSG